jgi:branched-chain amino acid transport system substrate-binding protein
VRRPYSPEWRGGCGRRDFTLGGLVPPFAITPENHEGGGWVQVWQVKDGKLLRVTEWFKAYPEVIARHLKAPHPA